MKILTKIKDVAIEQDVGGSSEQDVGGAEETRWVWSFSSLSTGSIT